MAAERRVNYTRKLIAEVGLEPERLAIFFLSSAEGARFAEIATEMTSLARRLGPSPLKGLRAHQITDPMEHEC